MAAVDWLKISAGMFRNRKIIQLQRAENGGDTTIVLWLKILCLAAAINDDGWIYITPDVPYSYDALSEEFGRPIEAVEKAFSKFQEYGMITVDDKGFINIKNWEKYQNVAGLEKLKAQRSEANARYYQKHKTDSDTDSDTEKNDSVTDKNLTSILSVGTDKIREDKRRIDKNINTRHQYGMYKNVLLSDASYAKLQEEFPDDWQQRIDSVSEYCKCMGKTYKDYLAVIRRWARTERPAKTPVNKITTAYEAAHREPQKVDMENLRGKIDQV